MDEPVRPAWEWTTCQWGSCAISCILYGPSGIADDETADAFDTPRGLEWSTFKPRRSASKTDFFFPGLWNGLSTFKPCPITSNLLIFCWKLGIAPHLPRSEAPLSYICFEPDYGLHLGLRVRRFRVPDTDSGITA